MIMPDKKPSKAPLSYIVDLIKPYFLNELPENVLKAIITFYKNEGLFIVTNGHYELADSPGTTLLYPQDASWSIFGALTSYHIDSKIAFLITNLIIPASGGGASGSSRNFKYIIPKATYNTYSEQVSSFMKNIKKANISALEECRNKLQSIKLYQLDRRMQSSISSQQLKNKLSRLSYDRDSLITCFGNQSLKEGEVIIDFNISIIRIQINKYDKDAHEVDDELKNINGNISIVDKILNHQPSTKNRRTKGRPVDTDLKKDEQIYTAWKSRQYKTHDDLATEFKVPVKEVKRALDRQRKRIKKT